MSAVGSDPTTAWETPFESPSGDWIEIVAPAETTVDRLDLAIVADRFHSRFRAYGSKGRG